LLEENIFKKENEEVIPYELLSHAIIDWKQHSEIEIPMIRTELKSKDHMGTLLVRLGFKRNTYKVPTGLYGVGNPTNQSLIFVTANYKYSFDLLRQSLNGMNAYILVLDTQGINVWCAAGKGTFSSKELIYQLNKWKVKALVKHKKVILPQLGAGHMEPHLVRRYSGFKVIYGPVRAEDIPDYIEQQLLATEAMRTVSFSFKERLVLIPVEVKHSLKYIIMLGAFLGLTDFIAKGHVEFDSILGQWIPFICAFFVGTVLFPILLPIIPFQRFSLKGCVLGVFSLFIYIITLMSQNPSLGSSINQNTLLIFGTSISMILITSMLGLVFTGSTTYTSYSGVDLETRQAMKWYWIFGIISIVLITLSKWI